MLMITAGLSIIAVAWMFYQFRQSQSAMQVPLPTDAATKAIMALSRVHQTATKDGTIQWQLDASTAELEADTGRMVLQAPQVDFFLDDGTQVHLTARQGILYTRENNIKVSGNVQVRNDRYTMVTEVLAYEHDQRVLHADVPVLIKGQTIELKAARMRYDLKTNQTQFTGQVEGIIYENPAI